ncbi:biotin--[acetyl-CoA-carboxylase] ligase [Methyloligella sp. 2.7D]|uniref:biotin--[acetyl-CoA-carboxylase] ligase n=1 Tax=unclassified Methyloligella TaxID=2625955 RepID=UPI00157E239D|nr:biotin--[acetyl-CoA-carboxylase] ligase [Methyloligella sp. GL2]QKP77536.1 biotin--[acetyl-CoA-carboxylase] ligase [Methyloligella sp. GL2]
MAASPVSEPKLPPGFRLLRLESVDSTNAEAKRRAKAGEKGPLWIWSLRQSAGRGRQGREWQSAPGNLFASLLLTIEGPLGVASQLSLLAGIAAYDAVAELMGDPGKPDGLVLKWPNDVMLEHMKLGGILIESVGAPADNRSTVVIGTGLNLASYPDHIPQPATSLAAQGIGADPGHALQALAAHTARWLSRWDEGASFQAIRRAWLERSAPPGTPLQVKLPQETLEGVFAGLDAGGALRLKTKDGDERRLTAGDVFFPSA